MAILSSAYLASLPFKEDPATNVREYALNGYYGLLDYFVSSWHDHLNLSLEHSHEISASTWHHLLQAVIALMQHLTHGQMPKDFGDDLECLKKYLNSPSLKYCIEYLERISTGIRKVIEGIDTTVLLPRSRDAFFSLNGKQRYKCSKSRCLRFSEGFESKEERDRHVTQHSAPFTCSIESCPRGKVGFIARADLDQHTRKEHTSKANKPAALFPATSGPKDPLYGDPLYDACARGDMQAVRDLTKSRMRLRAKREHIALAAKNGHVDLCQYFARNAEESCGYYLRDAPTLKSLDQAILSNDSNMFRVLVEAATPKQKDENFDSKASTIIAKLAVRYGKRAIFETLLSLRSEMQAPLSYSKIFVGAIDYISRAEQRHVFGEDIFWDEKVDMRQGYSAFECVMSFVPPEDVSTILSAKTLEKAIIHMKGSAMLYLMQHMDEDTMKLRSEARDSPLYKAIKHQRIGCLELLLEHGFVNNMRIVDSTNGDRPLHCALRLHRVDIAMMLLPYSMDHLDDPNANGETPLHIAVQHGAKQITKALLETGEVDIYQRDGNGRTVFEMAQMPGVQSLLREASGDPELPMGSAATTGSKAPENPESAKDAVVFIDLTGEDTGDA